MDASGLMYAWQVLAIILPVFSLIYVIPTIIVVRLHHPQRTAIIVLNVLGGWTFVGWLGALVWALVKSERPLTADVQGR